jgi:hypothetical protein
MAKGRCRNDLLLFGGTFRGALFMELEKFALGVLAHHIDASGEAGGDDQTLASNSWTAESICEAVGVDGRGEKGDKRVKGRRKRAKEKETKRGRIEKRKDRGEEG